MTDSPLRLLYIAYAVQSVSGESCGGAEQILWTLEAEMAHRGHHTVVAACAGSRISGELLATGHAPSELDQLERRDGEHVARVFELLARERFDFVHDHGGSFWRHAAQVNAPVIATLHLPRSFYPSDAFDAVPSNVFFNCVSASQLRTFADVTQVVAAIRNGIRLDLFPPPAQRARGGEYLLWLGRICEEKGTHVAIEVARRAGLPLIIAGGLYRFSYHEVYYQREIQPHLNTHVRHVLPPSFEEKIRLLSGARALLVPSLVEETSSLVAMEAMACGTPVIAFRRGAIPEIVPDGVTGFVVDSAEEMARAINQVSHIDPLACRAHVEANFAAGRMAADYDRLYHDMLRRSAGESLRFAAQIPPAVTANS